MNVAIIPARYSSTRFEGKPLVMIGDMTMIERTYRQALKVFDEVYVATDDERIAEVVRAFSGNVIMTSTYHPSGTDRVAEAVSKLPFIPEIVVNVQGDEPFIAPESLQLLLDLFDDEKCQIATLVQEVNPSQEDPQNPNMVKAVVSQSGYALYFSRAAVPFARESKSTFLKHIGLYGYRYDTLFEICKLRPSLLENTEKLEQLRWLEADYKVKTAVSTYPCYGIDTPEDLENVIKYMKI